MHHSNRAADHTHLPQSIAAFCLQVNKWTERAMGMYFMYQLQQLRNIVNSKMKLLTWPMHNAPKSTCTNSGTRYSQEVCFSLLQCNWTYKFYQLGVSDNKLITCTSTDYELGSFKANYIFSSGSSKNDRAHKFC